METEENSLNIKSVIEKIIFVIFQSFIPKKTVWCQISGYEIAERF
jgi:hypothetical protein